MKTNIMDTNLNRTIILSALLLLISACSGGNAGSSSGSGGADPSTTDNTGGTSNISEGEYNGNINFPNINDSAPITIDIQSGGNVTITSNDSGSATGSVTGGSFTASGTLGFNFATQVCTGLANIEGSSNGNRLTGTVSVASASCVENDVTTDISLDGNFDATQ